MYRFLEMPNSVFKQFEFEVFKTINRMLPKLKDIDKLLRLKKQHKSKPQPEELYNIGEDTMFGLIKHNGIWKKVD